MLTNEDVPVPTVKDHKIYSVEMLEFLSLCLQRDPKSRPSAIALLHVRLRLVVVSAIPTNRQPRELILLVRCWHQHPWLRDGVPRRYEPDFIRYYVSHAKDLLDDMVRAPACTCAPGSAVLTPRLRVQGGDDEEEESPVVGSESPLTSSGSVVTDLSSGSEEEEEEEESLTASSPARSMRRSIFLPRTKPIQTLQELEEAMRSKTGGVPTKTRKQLLRTYKHTFLGTSFLHQAAARSLSRSLSRTLLPYRQRGCRLDDDSHGGANTS